MVAATSTFVTRVSLLLEGLSPTFLGWFLISNPFCMPHDFLQAPSCVLCIALSLQAHQVAST